MIATRTIASILIATTIGWGSATQAEAQEVVQSLPPREAAELNSALRRLAARPTDLEALISAGSASLTLNDTVAAAGFYTRAAAVAPADRRVLLGQARVALAQRRPVVALQGFAQAESAGVRASDMAADRALAYDLVGDNGAAQTLYRNLLAADDDNDEVRRRLALSLAISGNRSEFEKVLYPMLRQESRAAYRTRAFGLAILGRPDEAVAIADAMMPTDLALRMAPYLRYMPRLTKSQQAAAANLGAFPAATEIGRDPIEIANYANAGARIAANASTSLTPAGPPLGPRTASTTPSPRVVASTAPAEQPRSTSATPGVMSQTPTRVATAQTPSRPVATPTPRPTPTPALVAASISRPTPVPASMPATTETPRVTQPAVVVAQATPVPNEQPSTPPAAAVATPAATRLSLADAFADLQPVARQGAAEGAVDITALTPARKVVSPAPPKPVPAAKPVEKPKPKPKAEKPTEPARLWAQVGVGRNTGAFAFDWKKLAKQAAGTLDGKGPWAVKYGATNRMLAGPYANDAAVKAAIKRLKDKGIEALPFSSDEGEKVTKVG